MSRLSTSHAWTERSDDGAYSHYVKADDPLDVLVANHDDARVAVYRHQPSDGSSGYLVVDIDIESDYIDIESDEPALKVYLNDTPVYDGAPA